MKIFFCTFFLKRKHNLFIRGESGHFLFKIYYKYKPRENMEDNRNSDRSEEEVRRIIREEIRQSRANPGEHLHVRTHALIR